MTCSRALGISFVVLLSLALPARVQLAQHPFDAGNDPQPSLPAPQQALIPSVNIAKARGWPEGALPKVAPDLVVAAFAQGLDHPRWLYTLPDGDVPVVERNAPPKLEAGGGIRGWVMKQVMKAVSAVTVSANRFTQLRCELGLSSAAAARPTQAALTCAASFSVGATLPIGVMLRLPT